MRPDVSILIPAYAAEAFIERTLTCARAQTHEAVRILVSVDLCDDATAEIAHAHAANDSRLAVFVQKERLGWADNINFLLAHADTPYHFIYFHDDVLDPAYVATLLAALRAEPDAASVHCDMGHFGASQSVSLGRPYAGAVARRLMIFMLAPYRGSPLRSLMRAEAVGHLRLPHGATGGVWANEPFLMQLIAAGPALHVPQVLYARWDKRHGGLTDGWRKFAPERILAGHRLNIARAIEIIDAVAANEAEREAMLFASFLYLLPQVKALEAGGVRLFADPSELHPRYAHLAPPASLADFGDEIAGWAAQRWGKAQADLAARRAA